MSNSSLKDYSEKFSNFLFCTLCSHDLNHKVYDIKIHPVLSVPLCVECDEAYESSRLKLENSIENNFESDEVCIWCLSGSLLFYCDTCSNTICSDCIKRNIGENEVQYVTSADPWQCYECNDTKIINQKSIVNTAIKQSIYSDQVACELAEEIDGEIQNYVLEGQDVYLDIIRLRLVLKELSSSYDELNDNKLDQLKKDILNELSNEDIYEKKRVVDDEISNHVRLWQRHIDILQQQEIELTEKLESLGFDIKTLPEHKDLNFNFENEQAPVLHNIGKVVKSNNERLESYEDDDISEGSVINDCPGLIPRKETEMLRLQEIALDDPIVLKYHPSSPLFDIYPPVFEQIVPESVLKALYVARNCSIDSNSDRDIIELKKRYHIDESVDIVIKYANRDLPSGGSWENWSFSYRVHKSILRALWSTLIPIEVEILAEAFGISDEIADIDDCGDVEELLQIYSNYCSSNEKLNNVREDIIDSIKVENAEIELGVKFSQKQKKSIKEKTHASNSADIVNCRYQTLKKTNKKSKLDISIHSSARMSESNRIAMTTENDIFENDIWSDFEPIPLDENEFANYQLSKKVSTTKEDGEIIGFSSKDSLNSPASFFIGTNSVSPPRVGSSSKLLIDLTNDTDESDARSVSTDSTVFEDENEIESKNSRTPMKDINDFFKPRSTKKPLNSYNDVTEKVRFTKKSSPDYYEEIESPRIEDKYTKTEKLKLIHFPSDPSLVLTLNSNRLESEAAVNVVSNLVSILKPHQKDALRFIWERVIGSISKIKKKQNNGCIIAHCMGLGKTLTSIAFTLTILTNPAIVSISKEKMTENFKMQNNALSSFETSTNMAAQVPFIKCILVLCPKNTINNWANEFKRFTPSEIRDCAKVYQFTKESFHHRLEILKKWYLTGGILLLSYNLFAKLTLKDKHNVEYRFFLHDPGPDVVIADEAHIIRNSSSGVNKALSKIATKRRIALTGSPLQNNLIEYWVMVNWVNERYLNSELDFKNRFVIPITAGQAIDSTSTQVKVMKKRTHVLNNLLKKVIDRKDISLLFSELPPKREFVITIKQHPVQKYLSTVFWKLSVAACHGDKKAAVLGAVGGWRRITGHIGCLQLQLDKNVYDDNLKKTKEAKKNGILLLNSPLVPTLQSKRLDKILKDMTDQIRKILYEINFEHTKLSNSGASTNRNEEVIEIIDESLLSQCSQDIEIIRQSPKRKRTDDAEINLQDKQTENLELSLDQTLQNQERLSDDYDEHEEIKVIEENKNDEKLKYDWWKSLTFQSDVENIPLEESKSISMPEFLKMGPKLLLCLQLLYECCTIGDKMLIFCQSLEIIDFIEAVLNSENWIDHINIPLEIESNCKRFSRWTKRIEYLRLDGSTSAKERQDDIDLFNNENKPASEKMKLYLISTKAGSMGINLFTANRVVLFDCGWNPADDIQAIARSYRYGQRKAVFVYRLIVENALEENMYRLQLRKEALAKRVVDNEQPKNMFNDSSVNYNFDEDYKDSVGALSQTDYKFLEEIGMREDNYKYFLSGTADTALKRVCDRLCGSIKSIKDYDSFLKDNVEEHLTDLEKIEAEAEYNKEIQPVPNPNIAQSLQLSSGTIPSGISSAQYYIPRSTIEDSYKNTTNVGMNFLQNDILNRFDQLAEESIPYEQRRALDLLHSQQSIKSLQDAYRQQAGYPAGYYEPNIFYPRQIPYFSSGPYQSYQHEKNDSSATKKQKFD